MSDRKAALAPPGNWRAQSSARLHPLTADQLPLVPRMMIRILGSRARVSAPNLFFTLLRHRRIFKPWAKFASKLMPYGTLARVDCELAILRVAWNCRSKYEWYQHVTIGLDAGLTQQDIALITEGPHVPGWSEHRAAILQAADEIHRDRFIHDDTWTRLAQRYKDTELIELCMLIGHYEMLASVINSLKIEVEPSLQESVDRTEIGELIRRRVTS